MTVVFLNQSEIKCTHKLTPKQSLALPLILAGKSGVAVAKEVGVQASTVSDWLNNSSVFKRALSDQREAALDRARRILDASAVDAAKTLHETATKGSGSANKTKAAITILDKAGVVGPSEGVTVAGLDPQLVALARLNHQLRIEKEQGNATEQA